MAQRALIMGIVNITPDSFSDGGLYLEPKKAVERSHQLLEDGADLIDLGAESTRPGSERVPSEEQWRRLEPVLQSICENGLADKVSLDARDDALILQVIEKFGIRWVNNVSGLCNDKTLHSLGKLNVNYICMHMKDTPETMQKNPLSGDTIEDELSEFYQASHSSLTESGFSGEQIYLDPGIGFGKDDRANLKILRTLTQYSSRYQLLIGLSRKSFIKRLFNVETTGERDQISKAFELNAFFNGAAIVRTHEVKTLANLRKLAGFNV